jgi:hypothetical protein
LGTWTCAAEVDGKLYYASEVLLMENTQPSLKKDIPHINISKSGQYDTEVFDLDMDEYFEDADDQEFTFGVMGAKYIIADFSDNNVLTFSNPEGFEGVENISIAVHDGYDLEYSNHFLVKVGTGSYTPSTGSAQSTGCASMWDCTSWTLCNEAGQQTRTCTDTNNCGSLEGKPGLSQVCTYVPPTDVGPQYVAGDTVTLDIKKNPAPWYVWLFFFVGLIMIVVTAGIILARKKGQPPISDNNKNKKVAPMNKNSKRAMVASARNPGSVSSQKNKVMNINELDLYISKALRLGKTDAWIKSKLVRAGWLPSMIDARLKIGKAKVLVKKKLSSGSSKEELKKGFLAKGWKEEQVKELF